MGSLAFALIFIVILTFGALLGYKRGLIRASVRTASMIIAALLTLLFVGVILKNTWLGIGESIIKGITGLDGANELLAIGSLSFMLSAIIASVVAILFYFPVYFILSKLMLIPYSFAWKAIEKKTNVSEKLSKPVNKWCGLAVGCLGALVTYSLFVMPICGIASSLPEREANGNARLADQSEVVEVAGVAYDAANSFAYTATANLIYKPFVSGTFNEITTYKYEAQSFVLTNEISSIGEMVQAMEPLLALDFDNIEMSDISIDTINKLYAIVDALEECEKKDSFVAYVFSDVITMATNELLNDGEFLGVSLAKLDDKQRPIIEKTLAIIADGEIKGSERLRKLTGTAENLVYISNVLNTASSDDFNVKDTDAVKDLIINVKEDTIDSTLEIVEAVIDSDYSDKIENRDAVLKPLSKVLTTIASAELSDEAYEKEAYAINNLIDCVVNTENIRTRETADRIVDSLLDSDILSDVLVDMTKDGELEPVSIGAEGQELIKNAIKDYGSMNAQQQEAANAILAFFSVK